MRLWYKSEYMKAIWALGRECNPQVTGTAFNEDGRSSGSVLEKW